MNRELRILMLAASLTFAAAHSAHADLNREQILKVQQYIETGDIDGLNQFINNNNWIFGGDTLLERALAKLSEALSLKQPVEIATNNVAILVEEAVKSMSIY